jgi:BRCT domain type II-containing protein
MWSRATPRGSKLEKALRLKVPVLDEEGLRQLLGEDAAWS